MRATVVFTPQARDDLREIGWFIGRHNLPRARSFVREIRGQCERLAITPTAYPPRDDLAPGLRMAMHERYRIFYRSMPDQDLVRIERILHGARDARRLLT